MTASERYRLCTRCVMDTSDPDITFDADGRCNHCSGYQEQLAHQTYLGRSSDVQLDALVEHVRRVGRGKDYDCVVGVSGGVDSTFVALWAKQAGLRPLAVHMDNGWNSDIAVTNIRRSVQGLGIDYESWVLDWDTFRDLQLSFFKASLPEVETPTDMAIPGALHRVAARHGVRFILSGGNYATEGILPAAWHYNAKDLRLLREVHRRFGSGRLGTFPTFGYRDEATFKLVHRIRILYPLNLLPYSREAAVQRLQDELNWQDYGGKHHESTITNFVQSWLLPTKFGIDYRRATLSSQICAGQTTRAAALLKLQPPPFDAARVERETEYVAKKLEVSQEEFRVILARPPRTYRDYPNDQKRLERIYRLYRWYVSRRDRPA